MALRAAIPTTGDHFVNQLGRRMVPARTGRAAVPGDTVQRNARAWAVAETKCREAEGEADEG